MKQFILPYKDFLNEANRGNYYPNTKDQFYDFINKYKGQEDLIFISFKSSDKFVSKINMNYDYDETPQGLYTYPYKNYIENLIEDSKFLKIDVPFAGDKPFLYVYKLKSLDGFLTFQNKEDYPKALEILEKIKKDYNISNNVWDSTIKGFRSDTIHNFDINNPISVLCDYVYVKISKFNYKKQRQIFTKYGIKGFVDNGGGFIANNEPTQSNIFDISCIEDYIIIDRQRDIKNNFNELTIEQKRKIENPKTKEDFKLIYKIFDIKLNFSNIVIYSYGWGYNGNIRLKYGNKLPIFLKNLITVNEIHFNHNENLEDISILKNLREAKKLNFSECSNLKNIDGLKGLVKVGLLNFGECYNLEDITPLKNIEEIGEINFEGCDSIDTKKLPKDLKVSKIKPKEFQDMFNKYKNS